MDNMDEGSVAYKLGINRSSEWIESRRTECTDVFSESTDVLLKLVFNSVGSPLIEFIETVRQGDSLVRLSQVFYLLGYMKGVSRTEDNQIWDNKMKGG